MHTIKLAGWLGCLSLLLGAQQALADEKHPEHDAVMKVVDSFFEAINTSDPVLMKKIALHDSMTYSVREQDDSSWTVQKTGCVMHHDGPPPEARK